jgi:3-oxoacyl-[acyl-carrier protein] reductase
VGGRKVTLGIPEGDAMWEVMQQMVPLRRKGSADDAAGAIMMLVSPWAAFITGQVVEVDGGMFT